MQPLNFCRQFLMMSSSFDEKRIPWIGFLAANIEVSEKFILPDGGVLIEDKHLKGLQGLHLSLPFENVSVEYLHGEYKVIISAVDGDAYIALGIVFCKKGVWASLPPVFINKINWFDADAGLPVIALSNHYKDGEECVWTQEVCKFLFFLNALSCSNVSYEKINRKKIAVKSSLPFDEYHVLVINTHKNIQSISFGGDKRSPRQHLRRGHIRRLSSGTKIWVNSCVVSSGASGCVTKDYKLK